MFAAKVHLINRLQFPLHLSLLLDKLCPYPSVSLIHQGKPKPVVSWLKDGQPLDTKRVNIRNSENDSIMFIRTAQREDSGLYEMTVKVDSFEDKATLTLQIVGESHSPSVYSCALTEMLTSLHQPFSCWCI